jgi:hypothetical protein
MLNFIEMKEQNFDEAAGHLKLNPAFMPTNLVRASGPCRTVTNTPCV